MNERSRLKPLVFPMALSLMVHLGVLSQLGVGRAQVHAGEPHRFTVSLSPERPEEKPLVPRRTADTARHHGETELPTMPVEAVAVLDASLGGYPLDTDRMRSQAREFARQELAINRPARPLSGDYAGVYSGDDSGIFFFHLDGKGRASGSGQSDTYGITFLIEGEVLSDGSVRMIGTRKEGESKFQGSLRGTLDRTTGKVSGSWSVPAPRVNLNGTFSGERES